MTYGKRLWFGGCLVLTACLIPATPALAQPAKGNESVELRNSPKFLAAFKDVVTKATKSTFRVQCDGKDTALGIAVSADGYILTKASDLSGKISVKFKDGVSTEATIVGLHEAHDLALLKIHAQGMTPVEWADSSVAPVGNFVASAGTGDLPVAVGVVSVASRKMPTGKDLPKMPDPKSGFLGVQLADSTKGAKIADIVPDTAASKAKIKANDIITQVNETVIKDGPALVEMLAKFKPNDTVTLKILRGDEEIELKVTLGKRPMDRADIQNNMGSKLSNRRNGFPVVVQHDSVVLPEDCGGPLVDLEGRVIAVNIARAGRVETFAIPSEVLRPVLADMIAGKLPPKKQ
jgi:serine protease Do